MKNLRQKKILELSKEYSCIILVGPRQVGKSTMLKEKLLPKYEYTVLDDFSELDLAKKDPALFMKNQNLPLIIDEVQRAPEIFLQLKYIVDEFSDKGKIILTGSQSYKLLKHDSDSLAGRVCIIDMASFSMREKKELYDENIEWETFYRSYVRTYIERDVAELINVKNLIKFNNFMKCLAARIGELVNSDALARDVGVTVKTIQEWTSILESSGIIRLLHPYENNITNRTVKTPKVYFLDTGLVCYLI